MPDCYGWLYSLLDSGVWDGTVALAEEMGTCRQVSQNVLSLRVQPCIRNLCMCGWVFFGFVSGFFVSVVPDDTSRQEWQKTPWTVHHDTSRELQALIALTFETSHPVWAVLGLRREGWQVSGLCRLLAFALTAMRQG